MSKKYKELPAFETNEFKVGDLVNVYKCSTGGWEVLQECLVTEVHQLSIVVYFGPDKLMCPFKACRKLVKVEPREFWITLEKVHKSAIISTSLDKLKERLADEFNLLEVIKVREILEEDNE